MIRDVYKVYAVMIATLLALFPVSALSQDAIMPRWHQGSFSKVGDCQSDQGKLVGDPKGFDVSVVTQTMAGRKITTYRCNLLRIVFKQLNETQYEFSCGRKDSASEKKTVVETWRGGGRELFIDGQHRYIRCPLD